MAIVVGIGINSRSYTRPGMAVIVGIIFLFYAFALLVGQPYLASRTQNLVWGRTVSPELRFSSAKSVHVPRRDFHGHRHRHFRVDAGGIAFAPFGIVMSGGRT